MHFYMNAHMSCQCLEPSLTPSHMHTSCMKNLHFQNKIFFVLYLNSLDSLRKIALFKSHVSFMGNKLSGVSLQASYTFRHFRELLPLDAYVLPRIQTFHFRGCLSLLTTTQHIISNRATLGRRPFFRAHLLNTKNNVLSCHALTPISHDVLVHMQCRMPLHVLSCYMHDESYMQHL